MDEIESEPGGKYKTTKTIAYGAKTGKMKSAHTFWLLLISVTAVENTVVNVSINFTHPIHEVSRSRPSDKAKS